MAFVVRSTKTSPFDINKNHLQCQKECCLIDQQQNHKVMDRVHSSVKVIRNNLKNVQKQQHAGLSIPKQHTLFQYYDESEELNKAFLKEKMKHLKELIYPRYRKIVEKISQPQPQFYTLPNSLSPKCLLSYKNAITIKNKITETPAPGSYNPKYPSPQKCPKFHKQINCSLKCVDDQEQYEEENQQLFAVKYKYMNSSFCKRPINLVRSSNSKLLDKLLRRSEMEQKYNLGDQQIAQEQYEPVRQLSPGPQTYTKQTADSNKESNKQKQKNPNSFTMEPRFKIDAINKHKKPGPTSYTIKSCFENEEKVIQNAMLSSGQQRFLDGEKDDRNLQYTKLDNSMLKQSYNRAKIGFGSSVKRTNSEFSPEGKQQPDFINESDYINPWLKDGFKGKFSMYQSQRKLFDSLQKLPGPGQYQQKHNTILINAQKNNFQNPISPTKNQLSIGNKKLITPDKQNLGIGQCKAKEPYRQRTNRKLYKKPLHEHHNPPNEITQPKQQYINQENKWVKKSFNRLFAYNEILKANNPIKYKDQLV